MNERPAVAFSICAALLRDLAGFRGYPRDGERRFVEVLQEVSISVEHARAIVLTFQEEFPTIREIRDVAMNIRSQFQPPEDQRAKWEAEYGKPEPVSIDVEKPAREIDACWKKIREREEFQGRKGAERIQAMSWTKLAGFAREYGYTEIAAAWERSERHGG